MGQHNSAVLHALEFLQPRPPDYGLMGDACGDTGKVGHGVQDGEAVPRDTHPDEAARVTVAVGHGMIDDEPHPLQREREDVPPAAHVLRQSPQVVEALAVDQQGAGSGSRQSVHPLRHDVGLPLEADRVFDVPGLSGNYAERRGPGAGGRVQIAHDRLSAQAYRHRMPCFLDVLPGLHDCQLLLAPMVERSSRLHSRRS
jgi:hypothetical protein